VATPKRENRRRSQLYLYELDVVLESVDVPCAAPCATVQSVGTGTVASGHGGKICRQTYIVDTPKMGIKQDLSTLLAPKLI